MTKGRKPLAADVVDVTDANIDQNKISGAMTAMRADAAEMALVSAVLADEKIDGKQFVHAHAKEAANRAKGYMIVNAIASQEKVEVTDEELEGRIGEIAAANRQPIQKIKEHMQKNNLMEQVRSQLRFEKTLDLVLSKAKISQTKPKKEKKS